MPKQKFQIVVKTMYASEHVLKQKAMHFPFPIASIDRSDFRELFLNDAK